MKQADPPAERNETRVGEIFMGLVSELFVALAFWMISDIPNLHVGILWQVTYSMALILFVKQWQKFTLVSS